MVRASAKDVVRYHGPGIHRQAPGQHVAPMLQIGPAHFLGSQEEVPECAPVKSTESVDLAEHGTQSLIRDRGCGHSLRR